MFKVIKNLRKKLNYSQADLAKLIGVSRPTFEKIELGKKELTVSQAQKLAQVFNLSLDDFLAGKVSSEPTLVITKEKKKKNRVKDMRISVPEKNIVKFKEVLLYILSRVGARPNVGQAVLCKLLYFIDFDFYEKYEKQLMGAVYIKNHHGPTPVGFLDIIEKMKKDKELIEIKKSVYQYKQVKYLPLRKPDLNILSALEKEHIDFELNRLANKNAKEMENYSHQDVPFISADFKAPLDYESVFYRTPDFSVREYDKI